MNRNKCNRCGLINSASDVNCRRCGVSLHSAENAPPRYAPVTPLADDDSQSKSPFSFIGILIIVTILASSGYYFYSSHAEIEADRIHREKSDKIGEQLKLDEQRRREAEESKRNPYL